MDLRGFTRANFGCRFQLGLLLAHAPFNRIRLLIDRTTDLDTLRSLLVAQWRECGVPDAREPTITLLDLEQQPQGVVREVFAAVS